ncbi:cytochrome P450 [Actinosynnema sp. NPDC053489]|uniref:cytochrome P450 n=1 Tax=Actinosynnema sp. NPDC053489 TaxID=3363916 RepID=UPI0037C52B4E
MTTTEPPDVLTRVLQPDLIDDPYPYLARVREHHPVHRAPAGFHLITRHADCRRVLEDVESFRVPRPDQVDTLFPLARRYRAVRMMTQSLTMKDPIEHTRLRRLIGRDFTPRGIAGLRRNVVRTCDRALDAVAEPLRDGAVVDLHRAVSLTVPTEVLADLFGFPEPDRAWLFGHFEAVLTSFVPGASERAVAEAEAANAEVEHYIRDLVAAYRQGPGRGLLAAWASMHEDDPDQFTHDKLVALVWGLIAGGVATVAAGMSNAVLALLREPGSSGWLRGGEHEAGRFVSEALRHQSPSFVSGVPRYAVRDVELSGVTVPAGAEVRTMLSSAHRDPAAFRDPDRFDPTRDLGQTLVFGRGIHYCLGALLARAEIETLLPALHRRHPSLALAGEPVWRPALPLRSVQRLPVAIG